MDATLEDFDISFTTNSTTTVTRTIINCSVFGGSIVIANNRLYSPNSFNSSNYGILVSGRSNHSIYNNLIIIHSNSEDTRYTYGIYASAAANIYNNVIYTGDSTVNGGASISTTRGSNIRSNTIIFRIASSRYGIEIFTGSSGTTNIQNNILYAPGTGGGTCIYSASATQRPNFVANNVCTIVLLIITRKLLLLIV